MPASKSRRRHTGHIVTTVVVCRNGAATLGEVLDALANQRRQPERLVAVDLGSTDETRSIITDRHGADTLVSLDAGTAFGDAVQAGLDAFGKPRRRKATPDDEEDTAKLPVEWIWLLHDDSAPEVDALDELLVRVTHSPSVWLVGPKIRDWSGERLVQAGLTIDAVGHIDAGVDVGELDQGQLDEVDEVLAVSSAGALIRRDVWDRLGGMDPAWSAYGDEVDLGWRVNAASGRVVVAPRAIMRHVGGGCTTRSADLSMHTTSVRRRNGMQVVLSNTSSAMVPLLLVRYVLGGLIRALGLLAVSRRPSLAGAELVAVWQVVSSPQVLITGRRERSQGREVAHSDLRRLFPAAASRWRNSPFVAGLAPTESPRRRGSVAVETGPVSEEAESLSNEISVFGAFVRRPASVLFIVMGLLALIADRHVLTSTIHGGRLLPSPSGASDLWSTYTASWHPAGVGSTTPTPTSIAVLALLATLLLGKAWLAVDLLVLGAVPLAALSAFTSMRILTAAVRIRIWVAVVYALLPSVTGAVAGGRLDVILAAIVLPRIVRAIVMALTPRAPGTTRGRSIRAALWLAIGAAFAPLLWVVAAIGLLIALAFWRLAGPTAVTDDAADDAAAAISLQSVARTAAAILGIPLLLLVPWTFHVIAHPGLLFTGSGLPEFYTAHGAPSGLSLALLRAGGPAQPPVWIGIPILAAAVLGLQRDSRVAVARGAAFLFIGGIVIAVAETRPAGVTAGAPATRHWPGLVLLVAGAGALLSACVAAVGARPALRDRSFGWRQPAAVGVAVLAVVATATLGIGWLVRGSDKPLTGRNPAFLPLFTQAEMAVPTTPRALVIRANGPQISYTLLRRATGPVLGDAETAPTHGQSAAARNALATAVRDLIAGLPGAGAELVPFGIQYVAAPDSSVHRIGSALGRSTTLSVVPAPGATVWRSTLATGELNLLTGSAVGTAKAGRVPPAAPASVLAATPGKADVAVHAGTGPRLAVLAEPAGSHWHATYDGKSLSRVTAYGWAQAFELPSAAGQLKIWSSSGGRHFWIWIELIALISVIGVGVAAAPRRPQRDIL
jgi:GT2 family glycosyltransferase